MFAYTCRCVTDEETGLRLLPFKRKTAEVIQTPAEEKVEQSSALVVQEGLLNFLIRYKTARILILLFHAVIWEVIFYLWKNISCFKIWSTLPY